MGMVTPGHSGHVWRLLKVKVAVLLDRPGLGTRAEGTGRAALVWWDLE